MLARIERAIYRLQNTHGLPLQTLGDGSDPEVVLRDCANDHVHMRRVLCELREAVLAQVGEDQTDRLRHALADALTQYRQESNEEPTCHVGWLKPRTSERPSSTRSTP